MKTTGIKSIVTLAMVALVLSFGSNAFAANTVDCGVVKLIRADCTALRNILAGKRALESGRINTPIEPTVNIGPVQMRQADFADLQRLVNSHGNHAFDV